MFTKIVSRKLSVASKTYIENLKQNHSKSSNLKIEDKIKEYLISPKLSLEMEKHTRSIFTIVIFALYDINVI